MLLFCCLPPLEPRSIRRLLAQVPRNLTPAYNVTYEELAGTLGGVMGTCIDNPKATLRVSRPEQHLQGATCNYYPPQDAVGVDSFAYYHCLLHSAVPSVTKWQITNN